MEYRRLGGCTLEVSSVCLGTMTFGQQNSEAEGHAQLDYALEHGINFIDTAEMYPVPAKAETANATERIVGSWLARQAREKLVIATKVAGPSRGLEWLRGGTQLGLDRANIRAAVEGSLRRLQTDYIDLYQIHWPARNQPMFGAWQFDPEAEHPSDSIRAQLEAMAELVAEGKIRYVGLSNEHPWGVMQFLNLAREFDLPRVVSIQNAYSLVNRSFETGLAEMCWREQIGLLAYSPLAFGLLSGKYLENPAAAGRVTAFQGFGQRYAKSGVQPAVEAYAALAQRHGISATRLALGFVHGRWHVASTIIGATSMEQLKENLVACASSLSPELVAEIDAIHQRNANPAP